MVASTEKYPRYPNLHPVEAIKKPFRQVCSILADATAYQIYGIRYNIVIVITCDKEEEGSGRG